MENYEKMWKVMESYQLEIDGKYSLELTCVICHKILIDAHKGPCGCSYCKKCIEIFVENGKKYCPVDETLCKLEEISLKVNVVRNSVANERVSRVTVKCPNHHCLYKGILNNMFDHLNICNFKQIPCPFKEFGCHFICIEDGKVSEHLLGQIYKHSVLLIDCIKNMKSILPGQAITKENVNNQKKQNKDFSNLQRQVINLSSKTDVLTTSVRNLATEMNDLKSMIKPKQELLPSLSDPIQQFAYFEWEIKRILENIKYMEQIKSEEFFSMDGYYKMSLVLIAGGCGEHRVKHICIQFCIDSNANIEEAKWPLYCKVNLTIRSEALLNVMKSVSKDCIFEEPSNELFHVSFDDVQESELIEIDSLQVKCTLETN